MCDAARFIKIEAAAAEMIGCVSYKDEGLAGVIVAHPGGGGNSKIPGRIWNPPLRCRGRCSRRADPFHRAFSVPHVKQCSLPVVALVAIIYNFIGLAFIRVSGGAGGAL